MERHEAQNKRMRDWFEQRTGLKDALLNDHTKKIDEMLANHVGNRVMQKIADIEYTVKYRDNIYIGWEIC